MRPQPVLLAPQAAQHCSDQAQEVTPNAASSPIFTSLSKFAVVRPSSEALPLFIPDPFFDLNAPTDASSPEVRARRVVLGRRAVPRSVTVSHYPCLPPRTKNHIAAPRPVAANL